MSTDTAKTVDTGAPHYLDEGQKKKLMGIATAVLVAGLALCGAAIAAGKERAGFSYLVGFQWATTIALGGLGFTLIWRVTKAGWPVANRRHMEWLASYLPLALLLFVPIILKSHDIYHHWMGEQAKSDPLLQKKAAWLNPTGFYARAYVYMLLWTGITLLFRKWSFAQDKSGDKALTIRAQFVSAPAILLYALSVSFAGFDWEMSTDPHWYSTIYGVHIFAGGAVSAFAAVSLITIVMRSKGLGGKILTVEHQHDVGKMLFGFTVFWAYIAFSQFILIWYANIPEETVWYRHRWEHGWKPWSLGVLFLHFVIPFLLNLSRHAKRKNAVLATTSIIMLVAHYMDHYFLVMPVANEHFSFSWVDIAAWAGPAAVLFFVVCWNVARGPLYPIRDPRVAESMKDENLV
jgi:hypothetical protein